MTDLATLADEIRKLVPVVPLDRAWWSARQVAAYLDCSAKHVTDRLSVLPGFPQAKRMPSAQGRGTLRWRAKDVIAWWEGR